jgi:hypothetical protein
MIEKQNGNEQNVDELESLPYQEEYKRINELRQIVKKRIDKDDVITAVTSQSPDDRKRRTKAILFKIAKILFQDEKLRNEFFPEDVTAENKVEEFIKRASTSDNPRECDFIDIVFLTINELLEEVKPDSAYIEGHVKSRIKIFLRRKLLYLRYDLFERIPQNKNKRKKREQILESQDPEIELLNILWNEFKDHPSMTILCCFLRDQGYPNNAGERVKDLLIEIFKNGDLEINQRKNEIMNSIKKAKSNPKNGEISLPFIRIDDIVSDNGDNQRADTPKYVKKIWGNRNEEKGAEAKEGEDTQEGLPTVTATPNQPRHNHSRRKRKDTQEGLPPVTLPPTQPHDKHLKREHKPTQIGLTTISPLPDQSKHNHSRRKRKDTQEGLPPVTPPPTQPHDKHPKREHRPTQIGLTPITPPPDQHRDKPHKPTRIGLPSVQLSNNARNRSETQKVEPLPKPASSENSNRKRRFLKRISLITGLVAGSAMAVIGGSYLYKKYAKSEPVVVNGVHQKSQKPNVEQINIMRAVSKDLDMKKPHAMRAEPRTKKLDMDQPTATSSKTPNTRQSEGMHPTPQPQQQTPLKKPSHTASDEPIKKDSLTKSAGTIAQPEISSSKKTGSTNYLTHITLSTIEDLPANYTQKYKDLFLGKEIDLKGASASEHIYEIFKEIASSRQMKKLDKFWNDELKWGWVLYMMSLDDDWMQNEYMQNPKHRRFVRWGKRHYPKFKKLLEKEAKGEKLSKHEKRKLAKYKKLFDLGKLMMKSLESVNPNTNVNKTETIRFSKNGKVAKFITFLAKKIGLKVPKEEHASLDDRKPDITFASNISGKISNDKGGSSSKVQLDPVFQAEIDMYTAAQQGQTVQIHPDFQKEIEKYNQNQLIASEPTVQIHPDFQRQIDGYYTQQQSAASTPKVQIDSDFQKEIENYKRGQIMEHAADKVLFVLEQNSRQRGETMEQAVDNVLARLEKRKEEKGKIMERAA